MEAHSSSFNQGVRRVFALAIATSFASNMRAEKPFDFALTPGKLPKQVVPTDSSDLETRSKAVDEVEFRAEFKRRLISQLAGWIDKASKSN